MSFRVGEIVRLKSECGLRLGKVPQLPDTAMKGCWHGGGPVQKVFQDGSYLIADQRRGRLEGIYVRRAEEYEIEGIE